MTQTSYPSCPGTPCFSTVSKGPRVRGKCLPSRILGSPQKPAHYQFRLFGWISGVRSTTPSDRSRCSSELLTDPVPRWDGVTVSLSSDPLRSYGWALWRDVVP